MCIQARLGIHENAGEVGESLQEGAIFEPQLFSYYSFMAYIVQNRNTRLTQVRKFKVCFPTHVTLRMFILQVLASQLHFMFLFRKGQAILKHCVKLDSMYSNW